MYIKNSDKFLLILLGIDFIFISLSIIDSFSALNFNSFSVQNDNLFAEKFQYLKFIGISLLSFLLALKRKSIQFIIFMIIPIYLFFDDLGQFHEKIGTKIASLFYKGNVRDSLISNFRYQDIGEISYMFLIAFFLLITFIFCFKLSDSYEKYFLRNILKLFFIFGIFAMIVDLIHQLSSGFTYKLLAIIEDGGEMIPISYMTAYFFQYFNFNGEKI